MTPSEPSFGKERTDTAEPTAPDTAWPSLVAPPAAPPVTCWRCGLSAPGGGAPCPHCGANLGPRTSGSRTKRSADDRSAPFKSLLIWYGLLLGTGIIHGAAFHARFGDELEITDELAVQILHQMGVVEAIDTALVVFAFTSIGTPGRRSLVPERSAAWPWLAALPLLAAALAVNYGYHAMLREILRQPLISDEVMSIRGWLTVMVVCVQPAIVEEAFFRGLSFGVLRGVAGSRAAVWISAGMFALTHLAVLLSLPYLFLLGLLLGYLRVASGGVALPIVVHFLHNLALLVHEWR